MTKYCCMTKFRRLYLTLRYDVHWSLLIVGGLALALDVLLICIGRVIGWRYIVGGMTAAMFTTIRVVYYIRKSIREEQAKKPQPLPTARIIR